MSERLRYSILVEWSDEDQAYLVTLPEWETRVFNPVTHGHTYEEAIKNGQRALDALIASSLRQGAALPEPRLFAAV
jgi:predicted RNase H-like HicB family nuclease